MRILVSSGIFPNEQDPTRGIYIFKQVEALRRRCEVLVCAPVRYMSSRRRVRSNTSASIPLKTTMGGVKVYHPRYFVVPRVFRFLHGFFLVANTIATYRLLIKQFQPDVILSFFAYPYGFASALIGRIFGIPVLIGCLGSDINVKSRRRAEGALIRWAFRSACSVLSVSHALAREIARLGPGFRVTVVPNGIDAGQFPDVDVASARRTLGLEPEVKLVCCVSRLSHEKGVDILVRAFEHIKDASARLILVGDGAERTRVEDTVRHLGLERRVRLTGWKPHAEIPTWVSACDVLVLPSRIEGHPNAVLEALACGKPVVATNVGGVAEILTSEDLGIVVEPEDPVALAEAIEAALARPWDNELIRSKGLSRTWEHVADDIIREISTRARCKPRPIVQQEGPASNH